MKSASSRSTSLLVEISLDRPMPRAAARESSAPRMPPLCETTPIDADREVVHLERAGRRQHDVVGEVDEPDRVRPEDAHRAGSFHELLLPARAFFAGFGVAAGEHDRGRGAAGRELAHGKMRPLGAEQHDADVGHARERGDVRVAVQLADAIRPSGSPGRSSPAKPCLTR